MEPDVWGIDGDIVCYRVAAKAEKEGDTLEEARAATRVALQSIINVCGEEGIIYLTDSASNFRIAEADPEYPYKGNRKDAPRPEFLDDLKQFMIDEFDAELQVGQEADDALSIAACTKGHGIATIDKDLDGCPGWHYNWMKDTTYYVSGLEADRFFYTQLLTGDSTDNIPGLFKRVGKKVMAKVKAPLAELTDVKEMYEYVHNVYSTYAEPIAVDYWLLTQGRCLWMRREEGELWTPPS